MTEANALIDDWMSNIVTKDDHRKLSSAKGLLAVQEEIKSGLGYSNNKQTATINSKLSTKANSTYLAVSSGKQVSKKRKYIYFQFPLLKFEIYCCTMILKMVYI